MLSDEVDVLESWAAAKVENATTAADKVITEKNLLLNDMLYLVSVNDSACAVVSFDAGFISLVLSFSFVM